MAQTKIKAGLFEGIIGNGTDGYFLMSNGDGTMTWSFIIVNPTITSIAYPGSVTAADPAGGETITVTGTGFKTGATVTISGTAAPAVSYVSATQITFTTPAKAAGDYDIVVTNTDTGSATYINGISYNGIPTWTTAAGSLGTFASDTTISTITLQATEPDAGTITFSITNGALPTGLSLTGANIDGTTTLETADTLYTFTVTATDDESQATPRTFTITVRKQFIRTENFTINTYTGNGSTQSIEGKIGTAASFNGSSSNISIGSVGMGVNDFTYSFWFNTNNITTANANIISPSADHGSYGLQLNTSGLGVYPNTGDYLISSTGIISANTWYHVVYVKSSTAGHTLYLNGSSIATDANFTGNYNAATGSVTKFGSTTNDIQWFSGKLDQVRFFNKALSSSEVTTLYGENNASSTKSTTDIFADGSGVALYEFGEGAKDTGGVTGYIGSGGMFNGSSSKIDLGSSLIKQLPMTISLWLNPITTANGTFYSNYSSSTEGFYCRVQSDGTFLIDAYNGASNRTLLNNTTGSIADNTWSHVAITFDSSNVILYINGSETDRVSTNANGIAFTASEPTQLGVRGTSSDWYNGKIDQVRIFNKALSSSEVTTLYGETSASATKSTADIFDDGSGVALYELEGNANDTGGEGGKFGNAAIFNGSSSVITLPSSFSATYEGATTWSFSAWVYMPSSAASKYIFSKYNSNYELGGISISTDSLSKLNFFVADASDNRRVANGNTVLSSDTWHHIVAIWSSNSISLYVDGSAETISYSFSTYTGTTIPTTTTNATKPNRFGAVTFGGGTSSYFNINLDQVRIYSSALSSSDVTNLYNESSVPTANLLAHYKLDGDATDEQGSYDGTATNVSWGYDGTATNVTYAYDGILANVGFVGTLFQPDLVWIKDRSTTYAHQAYDSVRSATKKILTSSTSAETTDSTGLTSFDANGFAISTNVGINTNNNNYVAWMWKAADTTTSYSASGSQLAADVRANTAAGFSIVKYTGDGNDGSSIPHGLNQRPDLIFVKGLDNARTWMAKEFTTMTSDNNYLALNAIDEVKTSGSNTFIKSTSDSSVIVLGDSERVNFVEDYIAYCFHSVDGYQKIGSFQGTGTTSGNIVTTGFRPRFLMWKATSTTGNWQMVDSIRSPLADKRNQLYANLSQGEDVTSYDIVDFNDDSFQMKQQYTNASGVTYIYLAIA